MDGAAASIRLADRVSDRFEERAAVGAEAIQQLWTTHLPGLPEPSDLVVANRAAVTIEALQITPTSTPGICRCAAR